MSNVDVIDWKLIGTCNLRCLHCYGPPKAERALPFEDLIKIVKVFGILRPEWVVLTGGEPLLVSGIGELMAELSKLGIKIALSTNSYFFRRHQEVIEKHVSSLNIPLDGSTPEIHALSRMDTRSFHSFFDVLEHYNRDPSKKPELLRVGSVYSAANQNDFLAMAELLRPFQAIIHSWKIYELIEYEFQPELRKPIVHVRDTFERAMRRLKAGISPEFAKKLKIAAATQRDKAYFMVNPRGYLVLPTDVGGVTFEKPLGSVLLEPLSELICKWQMAILANNYYGNHGLHYTSEE